MIGTAPLDRWWRSRAEQANSTGSARTAFGLCLVADATWLVGGGVRGGWRWPALLGVIAVHLVSVVLLRRSPDAVPAPVVLGAVVGLTVLAVAIPPLGSKDVWSYAMDGRLLGVHHVNPYAHVPADFATDPTLHRVATAWRTTRTVYGPLFQAGAGAGSLLYGTSALVARLFFQVIAGVALVASMVVVWRRQATTWAIALVGLSPGVLRAVNEAHIDVVVAFGLLWAVVLLLDDRDRAAGLVFGLTILLKLNAAPVLLAVVLALGLAGRWSAARRALGWAAAVTVAGYATFGLVALGGFSRQAGFVSRGSLPGWLASVPGSLTDGALIWTDRAGVRSILATILAVAAFAVFAHRWRRHPDPVAFAVVAGLVYVLTANYALAWYPIAVVPLLALARPRLAWIGMAVVVFFQILYVAPTQALGPVPGSPAVKAVAPFAALVLLALLVAPPRPRPRGRRRAPDLYRRLTSA